VIVQQPGGLTANITPATLTVIDTNVTGKTYDGTTAATLTDGVLSGIIGSDNVTLAQSGMFASANTGSGIAVTANDTLAGSASGNYILTQPAGLTGTITPATLTVTGTNVTGKTYDGTTAATLSGGTLSGIIGSDNVTLAQSGTFVSPNAGVGIAVTANDTLGGSAAGNYVLAQPAGLTATIDPATLTYIADPASARTGRAPTNLNGSVNGFVDGDTLESATAGSLKWATTATNGSAAGTYAIDGGGLSARNYVFAQAAGNADALTVSPGTAPIGEANAVAGLQVSMATNGSTGPISGMSATEPTGVTLASAQPVAQTDAAADPTQAHVFVPLPGTPADLFPPALQVVNGGVRIP
jgi:hypothetical protein